MLHYSLNPHLLTEFHDEKNILHFFDKLESAHFPINKKIGFGFLFKSNLNCTGLEKQSF